MLCIMYSVPSPSTLHVVSDGIQPSYEAYYCVLRDRGAHSTSGRPFESYHM
jgi:hypothetical protein